MITGTAEKILPGGEALVRVEGKAVLVANAVPGDVATLHMQAKRRGVLHGEISELLTPSGQRVTPPCPVAATCGGCALQYISPADQATVKSDWVADAFKSLMNAQTRWLPVQFHDGRHDGRDRRRVRWFVGNEHGRAFLGFYAPASHRPVQHADCMALTPPLNAVRQIIEDEVNLGDVASVQAVQLSDGIHIVLETASCPAAIQVDQIDQIDQIGKIPLQWWWRDQQHITRPVKKPLIPFHDLLPAGATDVPLTVGPDDFVQGQAGGNRDLIRQIQDWAGPVSRIADLFCGIGNLSLPLAAVTGAPVYGAELNAASVRAASANAKALGLTSGFAAANLFESFDPEPYIGADVLILDPPRRGAKRVCQQMSRLLPKKIIMISCDPAAGGRDGALLTQQGYRLKALRALDLFPFAGHVEAMSLWEQE